MKVVLVGKSNEEESPGVVTYKDDSFVFLRTDQGVLQVFHWDTIKTMYRVTTDGTLKEVNITRYGNRM